MSKELQPGPVHIHRTDLLSGYIALALAGQDTSLLYTIATMAGVGAEFLEAIKRHRLPEPRAIERLK